MKNMIMGLNGEFQKTVSTLSGLTGWTEAQTEKILELILNVSGNKAIRVSAKCQSARKSAKVEATKLLLKKYRALKWSIESGTENTLKLLKDKEFQRLMELEESVENQNLRSTALLTASNKVLWAQLNTALDCFREYCESESSPQIKRQYRLVYERYLAPQEKPVQDVVELLHIERAHFFRGIQDAVTTLSVILFGPDSTEDFFSNTAVAKYGKPKM